MGLKVPKKGLIIPKLGLLSFVAMNTLKTLGLGDALFSKTQQKVLGLLFTKPDQSGGFRGLKGGCCEHKVA